MKKPKDTEEFNSIMKAQIDAELAKTPNDMTLKVKMVMEKEGVKLNFTRVKKEK
jgi:hypothetical protein